MNLRNRILECLARHKGTSFCVLCIARELGVSAKNVYEAVRYLSFPPRAHAMGFLKALGTCPTCGNKRLVYASLQPSREPVGMFAENSQQTL